MENQDPIRARKRAELLEKAREAPLTPGVYLMKDESGAILYVGKAKSLKNRVSTYFQAARHDVPRTELLVQKIDRFDFILTETEAEALILECTLIKKHKPKFNVRLKDDKTYPYIRIRTDEPYPRLEWTRRVLRDGGRYYGPFPSGKAAHQVLRLLTETFRLRDCNDNTFRHRSRPCILFQMNRCSAPCVGKISESDYAELIRTASGVLEGRGDRLIAELERGMSDASEREDYEEAADYRNQIQNIRVVTETQSVVEAGKDKNRDVVGLARKENAAHAALLQIRGGKVLSVRHYHLHNTDPSLSDSRVLTDFLAQVYLGALRSADDGPAHPQEVLVPDAPEDVALLERTLQVGVRVAETDLDRQILNVARTNAQHALDMGDARTDGHGTEALEEIQKKLHLERLPQRIECYDISNIQGEDAVASRVVFVDGAPDKNLYRRYKIRTVEGSNDFAMMKEVLGRRFSTSAESPEALPDLVVVDGGKGQLAQAVAILDELDVQGVAAVGLAKARTESDFRQKEVTASRERIFIPGRSNPVPLLPHTAAYRLLVHIRDEAHRFAINYHRKLRDKRSMGKSTP